MKKISMFAFFLVVGVFGLVFARMQFSEDESPRLLDVAQHLVSKAKCQNNPNPVFTHAPADLANISLISPPIMKVSSGIKSHSYFETTQPTAVYAPVDSILIRGAKYNESFVDETKVQYTLFFQVSCEVSYYYDHLIDVPDKIAEQFPRPPQKNDTRSNDNFYVEVKAGELVGYSWSRQFDFGVLDNTTQPALKDYEEYKNSEKAYAVCPLKFFEDDLKQQMVEKLGYFDSTNLVVLDNLCE